MGVALWYLTPALQPYWSGGALARIVSLIGAGAGGASVFFGAAYVLGALDKDLDRATDPHASRAQARSIGCRTRHLW